MISHPSANSACITFWRCNVPDNVNFAAELVKLLERRELSALNCVGAIQFVLSVFEAQEFDKSRQYLQDALDQHKAADRAIAEFHLRHVNHLKKENQSHVRSTTGSSESVA